jgi:hemolysin III
MHSEVSTASTGRSDGRPWLRGWFHAAMAPLAVLGAWVLWNAAGPSPLKRASVVVFSACMIGLYTTSSLYHLAPWSERGRYIMSRFDVAMIQLFIAGTFTPVALHALTGAWRVWSLVVAWAIAVTGAGLAASPVRAPRWVATAGFIGMGWLSVVPLTKMISALPWEGLGLIALGGLLYTTGAIVYARKRPDPLPAWFGYHEIFHLFVVAASICHYLAIWRYVLPTGG